MFIRQLEYFVTLAKVKHFAKAAEICCITQPALSTAIRNLEAELGIPVMKRGRRYEGLTPEGERILQYADQILSSWKGMKQVAEITKNPNKLRMGVIPTAMHVVALLTDSFLSANIDVREHVKTMSMQKVIASLNQHEIDLGIGYVNEASVPGMKCLPIFRENFVLLARKDSEVAKRTSMSWGEAARLPLCVLTNELRSRQQINAAFEQANAKPHIVLETNSPATLYNHVLSAGLYSIVPHCLGVLRILPSLDEVSLIELTPATYDVVGLIALDKELTSPLIKAAWEYVESLNNEREKGGILGNGQPD